MYLLTVKEIERVRAAMRAREMSIKQLIAKSGVQRTTVSQVLNRKRPVLRETLKQIYKPLSLDIEQAELEVADSIRSHSGTNLPVPLTLLIGREQEEQEIKDALANARLVTLTGAGGCGKTSLALQVGNDLAEAYADGVWWVGLEALGSEDLLVQTVASALGLAERRGQPIMQTVIDRCKPAEMLLILDNCEQLKNQCAHLVTTLLQQCPRLRMLATSQQGIGISEEQLYYVRSLRLPTPTEAASIMELEKTPAVQLFLARARKVAPTFDLTPQTAPDVIAICKRLDGIPFAITLAARWVKALRVAEIAARLQRHFRLLTNDNPMALPRRKTLHTMIAWSDKEMLTPDERTLLYRLSVFSGGATLEAIEQVCADERPADEPVLGLLSSLIDKSLVEHEDRKDVDRYRLPETVRDYASERLQADGEITAFRARHMQIFLALAEAAAEKLRSAEQATWLDRVEAERDNLRAALAYCLEQEDTVRDGLRLAGAMQRFWNLRGYASEGRMFLTRALERAAPPEQASTEEYAAAYAFALNGAGTMAYLQGDYADARDYYMRSLAICEVWNNDAGMARALSNLSNVTMNEGDHAAAQKLLEQSLSLRRELKDRWGIAAALSNLAAIAQELGQFALSRERIEESLPIYRDLGETRGIASALCSLGEITLKEGDPAGARTLVEESRDLYRQLGDKGGQAIALVNLVMAVAEQGDDDAALDALAECLRLCAELQDRFIRMHAMEEAMCLAYRQQRWDGAARLLGFVEAQREALHSPRAPYRRDAHAVLVADLRARLGDERYEAQVAAGCVLTVEEATRDALAHDIF